MLRFAFPDRFRSTLLEGRTAYGLPFGNLTHGTSMVEHIAIAHFSGLYMQCHTLYAFLAILCLDFQHCVVVGCAGLLCNVLIFVTGQGVDFNNPVQFMSAGISVHTAIVLRSIWAVSMLCFTLLICYQLDRDRRQLWLQPCRHCTNRCDCPVCNVNVVSTYAPDKKEAAAGPGSA